MPGEEKKEAATQQAPAQGEPKVEEKKVEEKKVEEKKVEEKKNEPSGLDRITAKDLREMYKRSPQMFEEAEIVKPKVEEKKEAPKEEKKEVKSDDKSAAPLSMDGTEIKLPKDVPVDKEAVAAYVANAKEIGLNAQQVQKQIDFQVEQARKALAAQPKPKTQEQIDAENVGLLKKEFGEKYEENMEIARQAAVEFGDADLLARLKASDPVLVRHLLKIGLKNKEGQTPKGGVTRTGNEDEEAEKKRKDSLKGRYNRSPQMFGDGPK